jgi:TRAP-type mannitol/chloroaromatic compound transport system substrate-binding protein
MELKQDLCESCGLFSFPGGNTANQMDGWFRKEIIS